jgi:hypothetical protein
MRDARINRQEWGFTLVEMSLATLISGIVILSLAVILSDTQRGWAQMYERVQDGVVSEGSIVRKRFEAEVRRASSDYVSVDGSGQWVELGYASSSGGTADRYVRFEFTDGDLNMEYGVRDPRETLSVRTICENVSSCRFSRSGRSVQMVLELDDGSRSTTVVSSAVAHN